MEPLSKTNPYLRDVRVRDAMLGRNTAASCAFEGARGLKLSASDQTVIRKARLKASTKKSVSKR